VPVTVPGRVEIPGLRQELILEPAGGAPAAPVRLELRNWRPGDAYQPAGCRAAVKLKALFQKARVPRWERSAWPVLAAGSRIVWARRFGAAVDAAGGKAGNEAVKVSDLADISKTSNPGPCM
jgi:tRNA(Ile)-lysidine synthetase-like protein